jgi:DNA-binding CsgD family transcriptional regulator
MSVDVPDRGRAAGSHRPRPDPVAQAAAVVQALRELLAMVEAGVLPTGDDLAAGVLLDVELGGLRCTMVGSGTGPGGLLSPREKQIARMVADGYTNRAIATSLDISLWTVSTHLRRIFAKVGACSRAEMVAQVFGTPGSPVHAEPSRVDGAAIVPEPLAQTTLDVRAAMMPR